MLRKTLFAFLILFGTIFPSLAATHRLASYNVRYIGAAADSLGKAWHRRGPLCCDVIKNHGFDVVGFQEPCGTGREYRNPDTGRSQLEDIRAWLPGYELIAWDRDGSMQKEYVAAAYKKERYELLDKGSFFISPTPEEYSFGWDTKIQPHSRVLGWLKLRDRKSGETFIFASTHTNNGWTLDGPYGSQLIADKMKEIAGDLPVMVVADYNTDRAAAHAQKGLKAYHAAFHDAALEVPAEKNYSLPLSNPKVTWTYNAFRPASNTKYAGREIDYHFYKGMKALERHIVTDEFEYEGKKYPSSDHFPIYVDVEMAPSSPKTIHVDCNARKSGDGTSGKPFRTIGEAIAVADIDDTILLAEGVYTESVRPRYSVNIIGGYDHAFREASGRSAIDGADLNYPPVYADAHVSLNLKNLEIKNYTSPDSTLDGAILFRGADLTMENVVFEGNHAKEYGGALNVINLENPAYCESNNIKARKCLFRDNSANHGGAMAAGVYSCFDLTECGFDSNKAAASGGAIYLTFGEPEEARIWFTDAEARISDCTFSGNTAPAEQNICINGDMPGVRISMK